MHVNEDAKIRRTFRKIQCWKVVEWDNEYCEWTSPYYKTDSYVEGKILKSDKNIDIFGCKVTHGLHTFADESDARNCLRFMNRYCSGEYRLVCCEIPRFCRYIQSKRGEHVYASEKLKVVKFV